MSTAVLEINDRALTLLTGSGELLVEPGFAHLGTEGISTGNAALARYWLDPQAAENQFWQKLDTHPLSHRKRWVRHNADLAFMQLQSLWQQAGASSLIVLVPDAMADDQLQLLLGMIEALNSANVIAVASSSLLASAEHHGHQMLFADLHLHRATLCTLAPEATHTAVQDSQTLPGLGLLALYRVVARHCADLLIDQFRYDPLHTAQGEQQLYDLIPQWVDQLQHSEALTLDLLTSRGNYQLVLERAALGTLLQPLMRPLLEPLQQQVDSEQTVLCTSAALLPWLAMAAPALAKRVQVAADATSTALAMREQLIALSQPLVRIKALPLDPARASKSKAPRRATHLLVSGQAAPLQRPIHLNLSDGVTISSPSSAQLTLTPSGAALTISHNSGHANVTLPEQWIPGSSLLVDGIALPLIEVLD